MASHYPGMRLSFDNALCTVRYYGPLPDQNGDWLGVEWDDLERGKHNGQYKGKRIFEPLSPSPHCASFIRPTRIADRPRSFIEALRYKYAEEGVEQTKTETDGSIEISGKVVEEVGFERIRKQQAVLHELKIVVLDGLRICGIKDEAEIARSQDEVANTCPNIIELDLSRNLMEHWKDIAVICAPLKKLRVLKVSGVRLATFNSIVVDAFQNVEEFHLDDCLLKPDQILDMLSIPTDMNSMALQFPSLKQLSIAGNNLATFHSSTKRSSDLTFHTIKTLSMDNNMFTSLVPLCKSLIPLFPNLTTLSLQHNQVSTVESPSEPLGDPFPIYPSVTSLNLSHNSINNPTIISSLPAIFPNLTSLRVSANPFFTTTTIHHNHTEDSSFLLTLARLPNLKNLNYSLITEKDRMDGELYYLSVAEKALLAAFENKLPVSTIRTKQQEDWNRYAELCTKYDRENVVNRLITQSQSENPEPEQKQDQKQKKEYPPNSLGARLVKITFLFSPYHSANNNKHPNQQPPDPDSPPLHRLNALTLTIPTTLSIYTLKSLILRSKMGREWGLKPLGFTLHLLCHPLNLGDEYEGVGREEGEEVEIPDSMRRIGDWIDQNTEGSVVSKEGMKWCAVRILLKEGKKESDQKVDKGIDLSKLMS